MFCLIAVILSNLCLSVWAKDSQTIPLFNSSDLERVRYYSGFEYLHKQRREQMTIRSSDFFDYVLKQNFKAIKNNHQKEFEGGVVKVLEKYVAPMDLKYLINKELLKENKKYER